MRVDADRSHASARTRAVVALNRLVRNGGRRTLARFRILEVLAEADQHLSAQDIHTAITDLPTLSRSTVHRTLTALCDAGLAHVLPSPGEARFGLTDITHGHVVCTSCGAVRELSGDALDSLAQVVTTETGHTVQPAGINIAVTACESCGAGPRHGKP